MKQFAHEIKRDLWAEFWHGATGKQNTVNIFSCGISGGKGPK